MGMNPDQIKLMLKPGFALLEEQNFWQHQDQGLALFITPETTLIYRLPLDFEPLAVVGQQFHLGPLLPLFCDEQYFYILALSLNQVRFFQATGHRICEIPLQVVPHSLEEALQYDNPEKQLQYHSSGADQLTYHGHSTVSGDQKKKDVRRFFNQLDLGLQPYLNGESSPLILVAVDYLHPIFREVNSYPHLLEDGVSGNPDHLKLDQLHQAAWPVVAPRVEQSHKQAVNQYQSLQGTGKTGDSQQLNHLLLAVQRGQVKTLLLSKGDHQWRYWGKMEPVSGQIEQHDIPQLGDIDLLDWAAVQVFLQGGTVYMLDQESMPGGVTAAAIYRYEVPAAV
ncbi:MAG: hypothetical protein HC921_07995 [Synechococcaceae cyanobacterium SM2_3_1]|nr:hypothetical protein [Synechococcaceae cyanobacterium SM2_3_1]